MRKLLCSLLLLLLGVVAVRAQVEPQISSGDDVYEYYMHFTKLNRYVESEYMSSSGNLKADGTLDDQSLRVKLVEGTDDYVRIVPINASGFESGYICSAGTSSGSSAIKFSNETTYSEWKLFQQSDATPTYRLLLKENNELAMSNYSSSDPHYRICDVANSHCNVRFIPANANAAGITVDITSGRYYKIKTMRPDHSNTGTHLKNDIGVNADNKTNRGDGNPFTNNYIWKVDVDDLNLSLLNGQGSPLRVGGTDYPTLVVLAGPPTLDSNTYAFTIYLHCSNNGDATGGNIQTWKNGGTDDVNQWKFEEVEGTPYEVVIEGGPAGATVIRTVDGVEETALDGGFFMATEEELDGTFHGVLVAGYAVGKVSVDHVARTVNVEYKAVTGVNASLQAKVVELNALVEAAVAGPYVNGYPQTAIDAALEVISTMEAKVWAGDAAQTDVTAVGDAITTFESARITLDADKYYMFISAVAFSPDKAMLSKDGDLRWDSKVAGDRTQMWKLESTDTEGVYKLRNGDATYINASGSDPNNNNNDVGIFSMDKAAGEYSSATFTNVSGASYKINIAGNRAAHANGHGNGSGVSGDIIAWSSDGDVVPASGASAWKILPVTDYDIYEVVVDQSSTSIEGDVEVIYQRQSFGRGNQRRYLRASQRYGSERG